MADRHSAYWQGPESERLQVEYRKLISGDSNKTPTRSRGARHSSHTTADYPVRLPTGRKLTETGKPMVDDFIIAKALRLVRSLSWKPRERRKDPKTTDITLKPISAVDRKETSRVDT